VSILLAFPVLILVVILQMVIASRLPLVDGTTDLVLLVILAWSLNERGKRAWFWALLGGALVSFISALPVYATILGYLIPMLLVQWLRRRVWQIPVLAMLVATTIGTLIQHFIALGALKINGSPIGISESLALITLPSMFLNLALALPVYALVKDLGEVIHPTEVEQ
jgi:hypothetical protein